MCEYQKSKIDELFNKIMGYYPTKEGAAYEIISTAVLGKIENKNAQHNQFIKGLSKGRPYQIDGLLSKNVMIESKDYSKRNKKVGRSDMQKLEGALTDLPSIEKGYFTSPTNYTKDALCFAGGTITNNLHKEIVPIELRPSTEEDKKGRIEKIQINIIVYDLDYSNGKYSIEFADGEWLELEKYIREIGKTKIKIDNFYDKNKKIIETMEHLSRIQQPKIVDDINEAKGKFEISAFIKVNERFFRIKGINYKVPIINEEETFTIEAKENATILVKSERLNINTLITNSDIKEAINNMIK